MSTIANLIALALHHQQNGDARQAESVCQCILQTDPRNADAYQLLGVLACHGRLSEAVGYFQKALYLRPEFIEAHNNLGNAYFLQGDTAQATAQYREALRLRPDYADAWSNLGNVFSQQGKLQDAAQCYEKALQHQPSSAVACNNLALIFRRQDRLDEAIAQYRKALTLNPGYGDAYRNLGDALCGQDKLQEAIACYQRSCELNPNSAETWNNLGLAHQRLEKLEQASRCFQQSLRLNPRHAEAYSNLGNVLVRLLNAEKAVECYRHALSLNPDIAEAHNGLGCAMVRLGRHAEAIPCFQEALRRRPQFAEGLSNLGNALLCQNDLEEGSDCFQKALSLDPDFVSAHWNRAYLRLLRGDFEHGWPEYEWRWKLPDAIHRRFAQPCWDGSPLVGRKVLLFAEQGFGDTFQFLRFAEAARKRGGKVIVECQPQVTKLLTNAPGIDLLVARGSPLPSFDVQAPLLSIPGILRIAASTIPAHVPYLHADESLVEHWKKSAESGVRNANSDASSTPDSEVCTRHLFVGIAWQGSPTYHNDCQRSIPLSHFLRLAQIPGVHLISLQKGPGNEQLLEECGVVEGLKSALRTPIIDETTGPFMDTAALMELLDLVITSDSAVAHLAGALGVPVWLALHLVPDWRWQLEREDSPWYPSMHLFRQTRAGDWGSVFERIAAELKKLVGGEQ
jgi:tetratricopeptide (TPR) repeat protein